MTKFIKYNKKYINPPLLEISKMILKNDFKYINNFHKRFMKVKRTTHNAVLRIRNPEYKMFNRYLSLLSLFRSI